MPAPSKPTIQHGISNLLLGAISSTPFSKPPCHTDEASKNFTDQCIYNLTLSSSDGLCDASRSVLQSIVTDLLSCKVPLETHHHSSGFQTASARGALTPSDGPKITASSVPVSPAGGYAVYEKHWACKLVRAFVRDATLTSISCPSAPLSGVIMKPSDTSSRISCMLDSCLAAIDGGKGPRTLPREGNLRGNSIGASACLGFLIDLATAHRDFDGEASGRQSGFPLSEVQLRAMIDGALSARHQCE